MKRKELMQEIKPLWPHPSLSSTTFDSQNNFVSFEHEHQALMIKKQDEELEELSSSVERLGDMGKSITEELIVQEKIIGDVERDIDTTSTRLNFVQKKVELMIVKAGSNGQIFMIIFLVVLLIILMVLVFT